MGRGARRSRDLLVEDDGLTPYTRRTGKRWSRSWVAFVTAVWARCDGQDVTIVIVFIGEVRPDVKADADVPWLRAELIGGPPS